VVVGFVVVGRGEGEKKGDEEEDEEPQETRGKSAAAVQEATA